MGQVSEVGQAPPFADEVLPVGVRRLRDGAENESDALAHDYAAGLGGGSEVAGTGVCSRWVWRRGEGGVVQEKELREREGEGEIESRELRRRRTRRRAGRLDGKGAVEEPHDLRRCASIVEMNAFRAQAGDGGEQR